MPLQSQLPVQLCVLCSLQGSIPSQSNLANMEIFLASGNNLTAPKRNSLGDWLDEKWSFERYACCL